MKLNLLRKKNEEAAESFDNLFDFTDVRDAIAPSLIEEKENYIRLGENYARTLVVINYPSIVKGNWLNRLYRFKGNISVSIHMVPTSSDRVIDSVSKSIVEYEARLESSISPRRKEDTKQKLDGAKDMLKKLMAGNNNTVFNAHMYVHLQAENLDALERLTSKIKGELWKVGLTPAIPNSNMLKAFQACLPTLENTLPEYTFRNMTTEAVSSMFPFDEAEIFEEDGIIKGKDAGGTPVLVNQYKLKNHNEFIVGTSGAGKSFYIKVSILRHFMFGYRVFIIDPLGEYEDIVTKNNGQYIRISNRTEHVINPLETMDLSQLMVFFKLLKKDLSPLEAALIEDAVMETYKKNEKRPMKWDDDFSKIPSEDFPILSDLMKELRAKTDTRLDDFTAILKTYVEGSNSRMFNGTTKVNLNNDLICFGLKDLEEESQAQQAAYFTALTFLWDTISQDASKPQRLFVDECHRLADPDNPRAMKFLFSIYKQDRHFFCGTTAATQQVADYLSAVEGSRNYGKAIVGNSQSKMILGLEPADVHDLKAYNVLKLSEEEERILMSAKKGEGIFIAGKNRVHMQVEATPEELRLIDPEQYEEKYGR